MCETNTLKCQVHKWTKQVLLKKGSSALIFLEEAADLGCRISLSNGHFSRCLFLTESADQFIKRLPHFKFIPKSSSNWLGFFLLLFCVFLFCFVLNQNKKSDILFQEQLCDRALEWRTPLCSEYSFRSSSVSLFQEGKYIQDIHYLYPLEPAHADELL